MNAITRRKINKLLHIIIIHFFIVYTLIFLDTMPLKTSVSLRENSNFGIDYLVTAFGKYTEEHDGKHPDNMAQLIEYAIELPSELETGNQKSRFFKYEINNLLIEEKTISYTLIYKERCLFIHDRGIYTRTFDVKSGKDEKKIIPWAEYKTREGYSESYVKSIQMREKISYAIYNFYFNPIMLVSASFVFPVLKEFVFYKNYAAKINIRKKK